MDDRYSHLDLADAQRRRLLQDIVRYTETGTLRQGFMGEFIRYFHEVTFALMTRGDDFFALFIGRLKLEVDLSLMWPLATVVSQDEIYLKINPLSFLFMQSEEAGSLIKHEVLHLILDHHRREKSLKKRYDKTAINLALDVAVNQYIQDLPPFCEKLATVNIKLGLDLKFNETLEYYVEAIDKALKANPEARGKLKPAREIDFSMVHDSWGEDNDPGKQPSREKLEEIVHYAKKGGTPEALQALLKKSGQGKVSWMEELRKAIWTTPSGKRKTVTRRNRRQPDRADLKGELSNYVPQIIVGIDISGSIDDAAVLDYLTEIIAMYGIYGKPLRIIECDNAVRRDYHINSREEIRPLTERRRGTAFSPVFERLRQESQTDALLVYFTDGLGEGRLTVKPIHSVLWIVTGTSLSLEKSYGKIIYLHRKKTEAERSYGIEAMRELLHEWAK